MLKEKNSLTDQKDAETSTFEEEEEGATKLLSRDHKLSRKQLQIILDRALIEAASASDEQLPELREMMNKKLEKFIKQQNRDFPECNLED